MSVAPTYTPHQAKYFAHFLTREGLEEGEGLTQSLSSARVDLKADAASLWCWIATEHHAAKHDDKPWSYLLVPDDRVQPNATLAGLLSDCVETPDADLRGRFELRADA